MLCPEKVRYHSADHAKRTLRKVQKARRHRVGGRHEERYYRCDLCKGWHLTAKPLD